MTAISKKVFIDKLDDIVIKYNNTCHRTIKMKTVDVKMFIQYMCLYIESRKEISYQDS